MTIAHIAALAASVESETLEFKETTGTRRKAAMTVCAFLNQNGGQVLFGVTQAGVVVGQQVGERTVEELSAELRRIDPPAFPTVERIDEPLYPPLATREALANALCHRDYSIGGGSVGIAVYDDRLEVTSSGSLHFGLTPEKLFVPHESRPWNPLIARTFYRRGIIEEWGSGTLKMAELTSSAGLPVPEIEDEGGAVTVRFRHGRFVPKLDFVHSGCVGQRFYEAVNYGGREFGDVELSRGYAENV